VIEILC